jgi:hypothetical protein
MIEISQQIFPVCSYGRAENNFFHSKYSLCPSDLEIADIMAHTAATAPAIFPSHILDRLDFGYLVERLSTLETKPRVQFALGREWEELGPKIRRAIAHNWGVDILVDRPLETATIPVELLAVTDRRWVISPLHFFDVLEIGRSLAALKDGKEILLTFFEPRESKSLLCSPDEVIFWKKRFSEDPQLGSRVNFLILKSALQTKESFYSAPSIPNYQEQFIYLGHFSWLRKISFYLIRSFPTVIGFLRIHILDEIAGMRRLSYWRSLPRRISFHAQNILLRSKHTLRHIYFFFRNQISWRLWVKHGLLHGMHRLRYNLNYVRWLVRDAKLGLKHRLRALLGFFRYRVLKIALWPVYKIYWMGEYQYSKRIAPLFKATKRNG